MMIEGLQSALARRTDHAHRISLAERQAQPTSDELHDAPDNSSDDAPETRQIEYPPR